MNAERLLDLAQFLVKQESRFGFQSRLEELHQALEQLTSNPGNADVQQQAYKALETMDDVFKRVGNDLTPARVQSISDIGAWPYFSKNLPDGIRALLSENSVMPAAVRDRVADLGTERQKFLQRLQEVITSLRYFGIKSEWPHPGSGDVGFLIPREMFQNNLLGLAKEFGELNRIIATFSELATGEVEEVEVHEISTTDPVIFLGVGVATLTMIGHATTWALDTWKKLLEIRALHDQAKAAKMPQAILDGIKNQIDETVQRRIEEHAEKVAPVTADEGRQHELNTQLQWTLRQILAKVERGMTVEIRFLPPSRNPDTPDEEKVTAAQDAAFQELQEIAQQLEFPALQGEPLLALEASPAA
jgi:hypothetical protein